MGLPKLASDDIVAYKDRPGLGRPWLPGQVVEVEPHHVLVQPLRQGLPAGAPLRVKRQQVQALDQEQAAQVRRGIYLINVLRPRAPRPAAVPPPRPLRAVPGTPPVLPLAADPGARGLPGAGDLPGLAPLIVRVGPGPLRPQPRPLRPIRDPGYVAYVRKQPCCGCGAAPRSDPHHSGPRGVGQRTDDLRTVPLCRPCYRGCHAAGTLPGRGRDETRLHLLRVQVQLLVCFYGGAGGGR